MIMVSAKKSLKNREVKMNKYMIVLLLAVCAISNTVLAEDPPTETWVKTFDLGTDDWAEDIAVDEAGFIYVTGNTNNGTDLDWLTIKYNADGDTVWARVYDSGYGEDVAQAVAVDNFDNVYVVGWTPDNTIHDWRYIKYDANGNLLWNKIRNWGSDVEQGCHDIVVDTTGGYLYMIGDYINTNDTWDFLTVKCDLDGNLVGENGWSGGTDVNNKGGGITIDDAGYIYVAGTVWNATTDWGIVKYDSNLSLEWSTIYDSGVDDNIPASAIAVDNTGCVYLAGWNENITTGTDWQIVKHSASGTFLWSHFIVTNYNEGAWGVAIDSAGFIYVNGDCDTGTDWDCRTIKCDADGNVLWQVTYDGGYGTDGGRGLALDDAGYIYVAGHAYGTADHDFLTIKYEQQTGISEQPLVRHFSLLSLEVINNPSPSPIFRYTLPRDTQAILSFYTASGRKVGQYLLNSSHSVFTWNVNELPCGVYFARLSSGNHSVSTKICLTR
jgi:hypothetical protein